MDIQDALDMPAQVNIKEIEDRAVARAKAELRAEMDRRNGAPEDKLEALKRKLTSEGVDESAIENFIALHETIAERKEAVKTKAQLEQERIGFIGACYQQTLEAIEDVLEPLPALKNAGDGFKADLAEEVAQLVMKDEKFADIQRMVEAGKVPSAKKLREAAAQVADRKAKAMGLTPKSGALDLTSSKPQPKEEDLSPEDLPRSAKQYYTLMKNLGKSDAEAMARARQALSEMK